MRTWLLILAMILGSFSPAMCQMTCAALAAPDQAATAAPSCHATEVPSTGPAVAPGVGCDHAGGAALIANATSFFQLPVSSLLPFVPQLPIARRRVAAATAPAALASPPPLLIPLRI